MQWCNEWYKIYSLFFNSAIGDTVNKLPIVVRRVHPYDSSLLSSDDIFLPSLCEHPLQILIGDLQKIHGYNNTIYLSPVSVQVYLLYNKNSKDGKEKRKVKSFQIW